MTQNIHSTYSNKINDEHFFFPTACLLVAGITITVLGVILRMRKKTTPYQQGSESIYLPQWSK